MDLDEKDHTTNVIMLNKIEGDEKKETCTKDEVDGLHWGRFEEWLIEGAWLWKGMAGESF